MILLSAHYFKGLLSAGVLLCGINIAFCYSDVADTAKVEVFSVSLSKENTSRAMDINSSFAQISGKFAPVGAVKNIQGDLKEIKLSEDCKELDDEGSDRQSDEPWIGVMKIPATEYINSYGSRSCSVVDRVRQAMLIGASALLILTVNYKVAKKLDLGQLFTRPVVLISGTNASKVIDSLQRNRSRKLYANILYNSSFYELEKLSTLILWATCGRLVGWEGVVCLGNPDRKPESLWSWLGHGDRIFSSSRTRKLCSRYSANSLFVRTQREVNEVVSGMAQPYPSFMNQEIENHRVIETRNYS